MSRPAYGPLTPNPIPPETTLQVPQAHTDTQSKADWFPSLATATPQLSPSLVTPETQEAEWESSLACHLWEPLSPSVHLSYEHPTYVQSHLLSGP